MNIRKGFEVENLKALSTSKMGRELLARLAQNKDAAMEMLKSEDLLSVVVINDETFRMSMTLAHCLVFGGDDEVRVALSKMPARILELKTNDNSKVVEFLLASQSIKVREALAGNTEALTIKCGDTVSDTGYMNVFGMQVEMMPAEEVQNIRNISVAHLLLSDPSKEIVERISRAPKKVLEQECDGVSVQETLENAKFRLAVMQKRQKSIFN